MLIQSIDQSFEFGRTLHGRGPMSHIPEIIIDALAHITR